MTADVTPHTPGSVTKTPTYLWWQRGIIYEVYARSFMDSNGDGVGDLRGLISRLDYLRWLGVDAVWLSPIYPSPMRDFGYDVSDYTAIHPLFGTLGDFDHLIREAHARKIKLILDFVPNHTSNQHSWFIESRSSRDNPKRDWYIWRDPALGGGPPNNWVSNFGGSAWEYDAQTEQYYYHAFLREQPDLNWRNPRVIDAMLDVLRFWLERGVDGFRIDVLWHLIKDDQFRDNPVNPNWREGADPYQKFLELYSSDRAEVHAVVTRMRRLVDQYQDRVLIGEIYLPVEKLVQYYGVDLSGVHVPFNFQLLLARWHARSIARIIAEYEAALPKGGWPNWVLGNHDRPRIASRVGSTQARLAAMLLLTLRGTPTLYYGDEIGMHDVKIPPEKIRDPFEQNVPGLGLGRDPQRTPMQWSAQKNGGFTESEPWLPIAEDYPQINVETERDDPLSILSLYSQLIKVRRGEPALEVGEFELVETTGELLSYVRRHGESAFLVALNFGLKPEILNLSGKPFEGRITVSSRLDRSGESVRGDLSIRPEEGLLVRLVPGTPAGDRR
jgi:alpha-glucosidase